MRHQSRRTAAVNRAIAPARAEYVAAGDCILYVAGTHGPRRADHCHEITGGNHNRHVTKLQRTFWLRVSEWSHQELQGMPKAKQWALKILFDADNFDVATMMSRTPYPDLEAVIAEIANLRRSTPLNGENK